MATYDTYTVDTICFALQSLIVTGVLFRVFFCLVKLTAMDDEAHQYKRRLIHALVFGVFSMLVFSLKNVVLNYFA